MMRVAGIMSGTSLDGIDVAIVEIAGRGPARKIQPVALGSAPYSAALRQAILSVSNTEHQTATLARLHFHLAERYAAAVKAVCKANRLDPSSLDLIGCHGQTIFHDGAGTRFLGRKMATTLQIGDGSVLAELLGVPVVSDFRPRDMAAGGKGAPLVPFVDYFLFRDRRRGRVALNIGGIANITAIPPAAEPDAVLAFDTGPGNMVIDALAARHSKGKLKFDRGGRLAARGQLDMALLEELLNDPYYRQPPPKTAGREQYGSEFVERLLASGRQTVDLIATATALTAAAIAIGIDRHGRPAMPVHELIASGGGLHNPRLMAYLAAFLPGVKIRTTNEFGIDTDGKEAIAFAILAYETWHRRPSNLPSATGATHPVILGKVSY
jgi:anhydro-N-acetylmuramic acid kinase